MPKEITKFHTEFTSNKIPQDLRVKKLQKWGKILEKGKLAGNLGGNLSFRIHKGFVITTSGTDLGKLRKEDFTQVLGWRPPSLKLRRAGKKIVVKAEGKQAPSSETLLHAEIYKKRPAVKAIFHIHDREILDDLKKGVLTVPCTVHPFSYGTLALAKEATKVCQHDYFILKNHGSIAQGKNINEAGKRAVEWHNLAEVSGKVGKNLKLIIVRHGESVHNIEFRVQGQIHSRLTPRGMKQARQVAKILKDESVDVIFSSDLKRAKQTGQQISNGVKAPVKLEKALREVHLGGLQGKKHKEIDWDEIWPKWFKNLESVKGLESKREVEKRVGKFMRDLRRKYQGQTVVLVTHGGLIRFLLSAATGTSLKKLWGFHFGNTSVNVLELDGKGNGKMLKFNQGGHQAVTGEKQAVKKAFGAKKESKELWQTASKKIIL